MDISSPGVNFSERSIVTARQTVFSKIKIARIRLRADARIYRADVPSLTNHSRRFIDRRDRLVRAE